MEARIIQSLMARNRNEIRMVEQFAANYKNNADTYFEGGDGTLEEAYQFLKYYQHEKATLVKLVKIQKALKAELYKEYNYERAVRKIPKGTYLG